MRVARIFAFMLLVMMLSSLSYPISDARSVSISYGGKKEIIHRGYTPLWINFTLMNKLNRSMDVEVVVPTSDLYDIYVFPSSEMRIGPLENRSVSLKIIPHINIERAEVNMKIEILIYEIDEINPIEKKDLEVTILFINPSWFIKPIISYFGFESNWLWQFIVTVFFWLGIGLLTVFIVSPILKKITEKTKTEIDDIIWHIIRLPIIILLFIYGFVSAADLLPIGASYLALINKAYQLFLIVIITYLVYKIFNDIMIYEGKKLAEKTKTRLDDVLIPVIEKIGDVIIIVAGFLWFLTALNIDITIFLAGLGGVGLIIGLASQDALANFFAGMHILLDRPFSIGDYIKLEGSNTVYRIDKVGVRSTQAYDVFNHEVVIIPNRLLASDKIINMMKPDEMGKVKFTVGVSYGTDVDRVLKIIEEVVMEHPEIVKKEDKMPLVRLTNFGDSSLEFLVIAWIPNIMDQWRVAHELRIALYNRFREEGIEIPFPQLDVHIKDMPSPR